MGHIYREMLFAEHLGHQPGQALIILDNQYAHMSLNGWYAAKLGMSLERLTLISLILIVVGTLLLRGRYISGQRVVSRAQNRDNCRMKRNAIFISGGVLAVVVVLFG